VGVDVTWHIEMGGVSGFWEQDRGGGYESGGAEVLWAPR
jgi:hypothetical protein